MYVSSIKVLICVLKDCNLLKNMSADDNSYFVLFKFYFWKALMSILAFTSVNSMGIILMKNHFPPVCNLIFPMKNKFYFKETVIIISRDPPCSKGIAWFTTVPFKPLIVYRVERALNVNLLNSCWIVRNPVVRCVQC